MSEWQPIEIAPKNGASMLCWRPWKSGLPTIFIAYYANGWVSTYGSGDEELAEVNPTHWMPLPERPR
jgi:hypothetical protein